ncbi:hypothetical protein S245_048578, partial [Arachis hypogaea]
ILLRDLKLLSNGAGDDLFKELWRLCAGPLMDVPCVQDRVFYFPQGHIELLPEPTEQDLRQMKNHKSPKYDLPSNKIFKEQDFFLFYQKIYRLSVEPDRSAYSEISASGLIRICWQVRWLRDSSIWMVFERRPLRR